jgi:hypothetical protein
VDTTLVINTVMVVFVGQPGIRFWSCDDDGDLTMGAGAVQADANSANGQENSGMSDLTAMLYLQLLQQQQAMFANPLSKLPSLALVLAMPLSLYI